MTCSIVPIDDTNSTSFNLPNSISIPTKNNKKAIPISEKVCINSRLLIKLKVSDILNAAWILGILSKWYNPGPRRRPATIYAGIRGCLNLFAKKAIVVATIIITPSSKNTILTINIPLFPF